MSTLPEPDICVLGLGYVGLPTASLLATSGFNVVGFDTNPRILEALRNGQTHLQEAGLATLVAAACHSGRLTSVAEPKAAHTFVICVPTPVRPDHGVDLRMVEAAAKALVPHLRPGNLVILESTSPIGTTRNVVGRCIREGGLEPGRDVHLCYCPERVLPGNTVSELVNNDRIIGGFTPACAQRAEAIYRRFCQGRITLTDDLTAEMSKLMENTYRDVNIAVANTFACIAERAGIDVWEAIAHANRHPRVTILQPGPGVGGHCIPVDPWFFVEAFPEETQLLRAARERNDGQAQRIIVRLKDTGLLSPGSKLAVLGAAYKADIDDARLSPAALVKDAAEASGFTVSVHDPLVRPGVHEGLEISGDLATCLKGAAAAVVLTGHTAYRQLDPTQMAALMPGRLVYDARHILDQRVFAEAGFTVLVLGRGRA